jgi:hypothetical protein
MKNQKECELMIKNIFVRTRTAWINHLYIGTVLIAIGSAILWAGLVRIGFPPQDSALAMVAIDISILALGVSLKTDALISAMADLNFDEKIAVMSAYMRGVVLPKNISDSINFLCRLRYDLSAIARIHYHASPEQKKELENTIIRPHVLDLIHEKENNPNAHVEERKHIAEIKKSVIEIYGTDILKE